MNTLPIDYNRIKAFTLIELSIVLVVIGLLAGSVLAGRELINASAVRAQISQLEKYQTAMNTFKGKFNNYLPGDIPDPDATKFGFLPRGSLPGQGDGNGIPASGNQFIYTGATQSGGELFGFWKDLSDAKLIDNVFTFSDMTGTYVNNSLANISGVIPPAKIGRGNYMYVFSGGACCGGGYSFTGINYFGLSVYVSNPNPGWLYSNPGLTVSEAYGIDKKIDDGLPQSGNVTAAYINIGSNGYASGFGFPLLVGNSGISATAGSATTCYDNNNVASIVQQYSITQNNGSGVNCALSFKFQ